MLIVLLTSIVNASNHTKCVSLSNQKCEIEPTVTNLHPNEDSQEFGYYPFAVKLDRCAGSCNTLDDLSNKVCVPNKTEDLNLSVLNMVTEINESNVNVHLMEQNVIQINGGITINVNVSVKNMIYVKKNYISNPVTCNCENGKYLASIMDDSAITCDEIIYAEDTNFNGKNITFKTQKFYISLAFLLITIAILIAVTIYCYLIKYRVKHYHFTIQN